jgi:sialate O-acetylesterase
MQDLKLGGPFSNHLVLQRGRENLIWGVDLPGQRVAVTVEGGKHQYQAVSTIANSGGEWSMRLPRMDHGGPYRVRVAGSSEIVLSDVLCGEVWLASGQSNMELTVDQADHGDEDILGARFGSIRVLKIPHRAARTVEAGVDATWRVCTPESVGEFTAVGYFFARGLHKQLGVPVGIIDASWGGTYIESWISLEALRPVMPELPEELANDARDSTQIERIREEYLQRIRAWERDSLPADPGNLGLLDKWATESFDDNQWKEMELPRFWQAEGLNFNGVVWFRRGVELPKSWAGRELRLSLGAVDDFDQTYFNGVLIGEHPDGTPNAYQIMREYRIPGVLVRPGRNVIAVRVFDHGGDGGFAGPKSALTISKFEGSTKILSLAGTWKYAVELEIPLVSRQILHTYPPPPRVLAEQLASAALFHGMIAPLAPYGIAGFLWYQGENNVEQYRTYREHLVALVRDWRTRFGQGTLPFLLVQLAGFRASEAWPCLREAQFQACQEMNVSMATAIDLGIPDEIHPRNKAAVGYRLLQIALCEVYGQRDVECRGPEAERVSIEGNRIRVFYRHASGLQTADGSALVKGFELAADNGLFRPANAHIDGDTVVVESNDIESPVALRYAWHDYIELNLINAATLPALPFRTDGAAPQ